MKLKKIVSLALAGVMAVSMLAGCNGNTTPNTPTDPVEPGVAGISAEVKTLVETELDKKLPAYVSFADSAELNSDLEYAVEYAGVDSILPGYFTNKVEGVDYNDTINVRLREAVEATGYVDGQTVTVWNIGNDTILQNAENHSGYEIDDASAVILYAVSSAIGENALKQMIAEEIASNYGVQDYKYSIENTNGGNYNHEYTVSVSTYTKAVNSTGVSGVVGGIDSGWTGIHGGIVGGGVSAANPSVTFVAVQVVRTSTHQ